MKRRVIINLICLLGFFHNALLAQDTTNQQPYGIYMKYLNGYSSYSDDGLISNIIKVNNNTDKPRQFNLNTIPPAGWQIIGNREHNTIIAPYDSAFIPIRAIPQKNTKGGEIYRLKTSLYSDNVHVVTSQWIIETEIKHDWTAKIIKDNSYFLYDKDSTTVQVYFNNQGNVDEQLCIDYYPSRMLEIIRKSNSEFTLKEGHDTTLTIGVKIKHKNENSYHLYDKKRRAVDKYNLKIKAHSQLKNSLVWQRSATFTKTKSEYRDNDMKFDHLPLTIDFQSYDILSENPYASLGLYGTKHFDAERYLTYNFQFLGAVGDYTSFDANYQHIGYYGPHLQVRLGNINNSHIGGISMSGKGASVKTFIGKRHSISGIYSCNNDFLQSNKYNNYGFDYSFRSTNKQLAASLYVQKQDNKLQQQNKSLVGAQLTIVPLKNQRLRVQGDLSQTEFTNSNKSIDGYNIIGSYDGRFFNRFNAGVNYRYSTKDFVSYAGAENLKTYLNYRIGDQHDILSHYIKRRYSPDIWSKDSLIYSGLRSEREEAKISYRYRKENHSFSLFGQYNDYLIPDYQLKWYGGGIDYLHTLSLYSRINASMSMWRNNFNLIQDDYTTLSFRVSFRQRHLRLTGLYYYGARYITDHVNYAETLETPRSYYLNANYEYWGGKKKNILIDFSSNFNYRENIGRMQLNLRPNMEYYIAQGFKIKGYVSVVVLGQEEREYVIDNRSYSNSAYANSRFEMGVGFTKDIGIPVSSKKNFDIKFVAFCDDNGNGKKDRNEDCISNMLIVATLLTETDNVDFSEFSGNLEVITNEDGEAAFLNVERGNYRIETHPLQRLKSWYTDRTFSTAVFEDKTVYLPQTKGGKVYGNIQLEKSDYTRFEYDLSLENIKISAVDSSGYVYSCLTDKNGSYILNVPMGAYKVYVNEELFTGAFELIGNNETIELDNNFSEQQQNFFVKEKKRNIVIKKFDEEEGDSDEEKSEEMEEQLEDEN